MTAEVRFEPGRRAGARELELLAAGEPIRRVRPPIPTGFGELDMILGGRREPDGTRVPGGLLPGEITIVAGGTGVNKSAFVEQVSLDASQVVPVSHFALEMREEKTVDRFVAKLMRLDLASVKNLMQHRPQHPGLQAALGELSSGHDLTVEQREWGEPFTIAHVRAIAQANGARLVVLDDLQSLDGWNDGGRDQHKANLAIVRELRAIAVELDTHLLIAHQFVKDWQRRPGQRPGIQHLADAAQLARDADAVLLLHRPFFGESEHLDRILETIVAKNRNGRVCLTHVERLGSYLAFREMTVDEQRELACCKPKRGKR